MKLKKELHDHCVTYVKQCLQNINTSITSHKNALESETKSSAGDKHETGRAMLQLEMEKAGFQLKEVQKLQEVLAKINTDETTSNVSLGSIVYTNKFNYFLSISSGKILIDTIEFFAVSTASPIGKILLGKQEGSSFSFNGNSINIIKIT